MTKQCLDIEQAKHLQELGVEKSNSDVFWVKYVGDEHVKLKNICKCGEFLVKTKGKTSITQKVEGCEVVPTFTLQDILDLLPKSIITKDFHQDKTRLVLDFLDNNIGYAYYFETYGGFSFYKQFECCEGNMLDAAYQMFCWCIEQGYVETKKED